MHLDLSVLRPVGAHRDGSPVTRGRAAVSTQLGEAQVSSDLGCVEFEIKPNILLTAKPGAAKLNRALPKTFTTEWRRKLQPEERLFYACFYFFKPHAFHK